MPRLLLYARVFSSPRAMRIIAVAAVMLVAMVSTAGASNPPCAFGDFPDMQDILNLLMGGNPYDYN